MVTSMDVQEPQVRLAPFPHAVVDGVFSRDMVRLAASSWPTEEWSGWGALYDSALERKRTCEAWQVMPREVSALLSRMLLLPVPSWLGLGPAVPDTSLYGAGMHHMSPGGQLGVHLDHDTSPRLNLARRCNAILCLSEWQPGDGGELELYRGTWEQPEGEPCLVEPVQGRLVVFRACTVPTWHGVRTITGKRSRKSLAVYWYAEPTGQECNRWRALFAPRPGHQETEEERLARVSR